jgi:hypothetical protein
MEMDESTNNAIDSYLESGNSYAINFLNNTQTTITEKNGIINAIIVLRKNGKCEIYADGKMYGKGIREIHLDKIGGIKYKFVAKVKAAAHKWINTDLEGVKTLFGGD